MPEGILLCTLCRTLGVAHDGGHLVPTHLVTVIDHFGRDWQMTQRDYSNLSDTTRAIMPAAWSALDTAQGVT